MQHLHDAGYDVYANEDMIIPPQSTRILNTGVYVTRNDLANRGFLKLESRSSMAMRGIVVIGGIIDNSYREEIRVILLNTNTQPHIIKRYDKIAQIIAYSLIANFKFGYRNDGRLCTILPRKNKLRKC